MRSCSYRLLENRQFSLSQNEADRSHPLGVALVLFCERCLAVPQVGITLVTPIFYLEIHIMKCPKCGYKRTKQDDALYPLTDCPKCGVIYSRVTIKHHKEKNRQEKFIGEKNRKKVIDGNAIRKIRQMAPKINKMPYKQRIDAILEMTTRERAVFLKAESTVEALKDKSFLQRSKYLYGGLWRRYRLFMNGAFMQRIMAGFLIFCGLLVVGAVIYEDLSSSQVKYSSASVRNSDWDGSVAQVKSWLKSNVKDPSSLEFIDWSPVTETENGYLVRVKYRAKNSFGAFVVEEKLFVLDSSGSIIKWSNYYHNYLDIKD